MDTATITLIMGLISCVIGISTFISGRMAKAENDGAMETKINQALEGIESINKKLEKSTNSQHNTELTVSRHEEQLTTLFRRNEEFHMLVEEGNKTRELILQFIQALQQGK